MLTRVLSPVLVGRQEELAQLEDALLSANRGGGRFVLLTGEAGIGKTRLANELGRQAVNAVLAGVAAGHLDTVAYLPTAPVLENAVGYTAFLPDATGRLVRVRKRDDVHFCPAGAARVQEFHRQLFANASDEFRQEIKRITGRSVREAAAEVEAATGSVVHAFTTGTMVQVFLLAKGVAAGTKSEYQRPDPL